MKLAIKTLDIIFIAINAIGLILTFALQGVIKNFFQYAYDSGNFTVNDHPATQEDLDLVMKMVPIICGIVAVVIIISIIILALNLYFVSKDNFSAILVMGIIFCVFGNYVIGALNIIYHILEKDKSDFEQKKKDNLFYEPEEPHVNDEGKVGF